MHPIDMSYDEYGVLEDDAEYLWPDNEINTAATLIELYGLPPFKED